MKVYSHWWKLFPNGPGRHVCDYSWNHLSPPMSRHWGVREYSKILEQNVDNDSRMAPRATEQCKKNRTKSFEILPNKSFHYPWSSPKSSRRLPLITNKCKQMPANIQNMSRSVANKCLRILKSNRRGPTNPEDPFNKFLETWVWDEYLPKTWSGMLVTF